MKITLNGNYQRLLQVLLNLVGNAVKFTHEGGITISAEVKSQRVEYQGKVWPGTVKLSVADTGIGVSLEKQDRLFQTFSQVDGERTRQYGGTGLGLAISQKLVEAMGGVVQFIRHGGRTGINGNLYRPAVSGAGHYLINSRSIRPIIKASGQQPSFWVRCNQGSDKNSGRWAWVSDSRRCRTSHSFF